MADFNDPREFEMPPLDDDFEENTYDENINQGDDQETYFGEKLPDLDLSGMSPKYWSD